MAQIYLIRHAKSLANIHNLFGTDASLSDEGIKAAYGKRMKSKKSSSPI